MYPLPDLHSSTPSFMLPIMDSKLRVTARQSRKRNMHTVTTVACIILPLPQHLSLCQLLHIIAFVTCLYMHELFHLALIIDIDSEKTKMLMRAATVDRESHETPRTVLCAHASERLRLYSTSETIKILKYGMENKPHCYLFFLSHLLFFFFVSTLNPISDLWFHSPPERYRGIKQSRSLQKPETNT
jgi:hypothetical protein